MDDGFQDDSDTPWMIKMYWAMTAIRGLGRIDALIDCSETRLNRYPNQVPRFKKCLTTRNYNDLGGWTRLPKLSLSKKWPLGLQIRFVERELECLTVRLMISFISLWLICKGFSWITRTLLAKSLHFMLAAFNSWSLLMQVLSSIIDKKISAYRNFLTGRK